MNTRKISTFFLAAAMATTTAGMIAQNRDGWNGHDNGRHEGWDRGRGNPHNSNNNDWRFRDDDRARFARYYRNDLSRYNRYPDRRHRYDFRAGGYIPQGVTFRAVPSTYYRGLAPLPPGYRYGYSDGYVVAYNPANRMIADVLDLVGTAMMTR